MQTRLVWVHIWRKLLDALSVLVNRTAHLVDHKVEAHPLVPGFFDVTDSKRGGCSRMDTRRKVDIVWQRL